MSTKPRQKHLQNVWIKQDGKYDTKKKSKPWKKRDQPEEAGIFDNVNMSDLMEGFHNRGTAKRFAKHTFRQRME